MTKYRIRKRVILSLLLVTPLGFTFKFYSGTGHWWFNDNGAGLLYEVFWILILFFFVPRKGNVASITIWVFLVTCALEVLQLWHPWFLEKIRSYFLGSALIGTTFAWWDFPHYAVGCMIGYVWLKLLIKEGRLRRRVY